MTLHSTYKSLNKKQKGLIIQAIMAHQDFTKSKEWLRKYLVGAYPKLDVQVEKIGLEATTKIGVSTPSLLPFRLDKLVKKEMSFAVVEQPFSLENASKSVFQRIFDDNIYSNSVSKIGKAWIRFGRIGTKGLHKINPFKIITHLIAGLRNEDKDDFEMIDELKLLYNQHLNSTKEYLYLPAWELFSQKSRFIYFLNPFRAIKSVILS